MSRKPWDLAFSAEPEEVAALRRVMRLHLGLWGLHEVTDEAQLCVSELVSNVIAHVGNGTPATLAVSMNGTYLRIEVHDPDTRALPTLMAADSDSEGGRGMALVDAVADRWGVQLRPDRKVTWCELATGLTAPHGHLGGLSVSRAEALLGLYAGTQLPGDSQEGRLSSTIAEEAVIDVVTDLLHWLRAHGCDSDEIIDRAQRHFDAQTERTP
ncbi:ATP-binding protein [Streptomyces sp. NL15-2K]|uniref:ATP-binding protein n=1 Tax=Streptomyces sp. NL15-2K TaxID=376149 RepID=UPI000F5780F4|nr:MULTISPECIES: ATP-binding protein [Actinomycetes]WKX09468.1 ATP-binding protein [Kutzneria buriramensis]GCB49024.1 Cys-tRNA(Pro) deacylase ybaK [Streptomyces sp. NL15-2K]